MRKKSSRKSKSEIRLFKYLKKKLPELKIIPNDTKICHGFELDIAIPELKLAIEWNGIFHREPIYGMKKLQSIQKNDCIKRKILSKLNWSIVTIDDIDSKNPLKYSKMALDIILDIIKSHEYEKVEEFKITVQKEMLKTG